MPFTGRQLFTGPTAYAVFDKQVNELPPAVPGVPPALDQLLRDLLEKDAFRFCCCCPSLDCPACTRSERGKSRKCRRTRLPPPFAIRNSNEFA